MSHVMHPIFIAKKSEWSLNCKLIDMLEYSVTKCWLPIVVSRKLKSKKFLMDKIFKFKLDIFIQMISIAELNAEINERILLSQSEILKMKDNCQSFYQKIFSVCKSW